MSRPVRLLAWGGAIALVVAGLLSFLSMLDTETPPQSSKDRRRHRTPKTPVVPAPHEPPGDVVRRLEFYRYEEIEKMGGLPVTITATGQNLVLHPKLYSVRKDSCLVVPRRPDAYECHLTIKVSLDPDGRDPTEQGERIGVRWLDGEWVLD